MGVYCRTVASFLTAREGERCWKEKDAGRKGKVREGREGRDKRGYFFWFFCFFLYSCLLDDGMIDSYTIYYYYTITTTTTTTTATTTTATYLLYSVLFGIM
ncbi:hypothetical protein BZA77DRAFT_302321 [Pyronema omphalodes]|nr:hypothetical protein BZA77DRAFT_302321 [Pyronema omphalodes]